MPGSTAWAISAGDADVSTVALVGTTLEICIRFESCNPASWRAKSKTVSLVLAEAVPPVTARYDARAIGGRCIGVSCQSRHKASSILTLLVAGHIKMLI